MPEITFERDLSARIDAVAHESEATLREVAATSRSLRRLADDDAKTALRETVVTLRAGTATLDAMHRAIDRSVPVMESLDRTREKLDAALDDARVELAALRRQTARLGYLLAFLALGALVAYAVVRRRRRRQEHQRRQNSSRQG